MDALLLKLIHERVQRGKPMPDVKPMRSVPSFRVFRLAGEAGEQKSVVLVNFKMFKPIELFATDTFTRPGYGTRIVSMFYGSLNVLPSSVPTWMFEKYILPEERPALEKFASLMGTEYEDDCVREASARLRYANAAAKFSWPTCNAGISVTINIGFDADCVWEAVFWGVEL